MRFKIDFESKFTIYALFYFVATLYLRAILQVQAPGGLTFGGAILRRVFCVTGLGGLYFYGICIYKITKIVRTL